MKRRRSSSSSSSSSSSIMVSALAAMVMSSSRSSSSSFLNTVTAFAPSVLLSRQHNGGRRTASRLFGNNGGKDGTKSENLPFLDVSYTDDLTTSIGGYNRPIINWYPGHIAKAESLLSETLKAVDIVLEVRDSRAPKATAHPRVAEWSGGKPRIVVLTKVDLIPRRNVGLWKRRWEKQSSDGDTDEDLFAGYGTVTTAAVATTNDKQVRNRALQALQEREKFNKNPKNNNKQWSESKKAAHKLQEKKKQNQNVATRIEDMLFIDAKRGQGIHALHRSIWKAGQHVNERRARRGLADRALRVGVIGYPNVGKSALINRILGRKRARSSDTPGITRSLQWIRVRSAGSNSKNKEFELLDSPGIIPANMFEQQSDAMLLAACNSIGTGAYDNQAVASYLMEWLKTMHLMGKQDLSSPHFRERCQERYRFDPMVPGVTDNDDYDKDDDRLMTGEDMLYRVAENTCRGDAENAARKILQDFRTGRLGQVALQFAPEVAEDERGGVSNKSSKYDVESNMKRSVVDFSAMVGASTVPRGQSLDERRRMKEEETERRAQAAMDLAKERGLELPPVAVQDTEVGSHQEDTVGKGMFDGW